MSTSLTPSDAPLPYEGENPPSHHSSSRPSQHDPKTPSDLTSHVSPNTNPSSSHAPHGLLAKLKEKKDAFKQDLDEGIARGKSDEGAQLANQWSLQHIYASLGVPIASIEKWQEHEDKKREKKEFDEVYKDVDWGEAGNGGRDLKEK